jgi:hypothetical protein
MHERDQELRAERPYGKRNPRCTWQNIVKMDVTETVKEHEDWIHRVQSKEH